MNAILVNILVAVGCLVGGYLLGSISNGIIIGKVFFKKDPRDYFSHNAGGTNCVRVFGKAVGFTVIALDMLKAVLAVYLAYILLTHTGIASYMRWENGYEAAPLYYWLAGAAAGIGHCWPIYYGFKGGKAVACYLGIVAFTSWLGIIVTVVSFGVVFLKSKIVSISSLISGGCCLLSFMIIAFIQSVSGVYFEGIFNWAFGHGGLYIGWEMVVAFAALYAMLVVRHSANIKRLKEGTESSFSKKA